MKKILLTIFLLSQFCAAQTWTRFTPYFKNLPGHSGTFDAHGYTSLCFDDTTRSILTYQGYFASGETPPYNATIYSNAPMQLTRTGGDTLSVLALHNWYNENPGVSYPTTTNSNFVTTPTPPDVHPFFGCHGGKIWLFGGLNQSIRDTIDILAANVNTGTEACSLQRKLGAWTTQDAVNLTTSGTLPSPLLPGTDYYIIRDDSLNINFASSAYNASIGTPINLLTQGTGTHHMFHSQTDVWHYNDVWEMSIMSPTYIMHPSVKNQWFRGPNGFITSTVWDDAQSRYLNQYWRGNTATAEYTWQYLPATDSMVEMTAAGNRRSGESPEMISANCMAYDRRIGRTWVYGDGDTVNGSAEAFGRSLWYLDDTGTTWHEKTPVTPRPSYRDYHAVMYVAGPVSDSDVILIAGGQSPAGVNLKDAWVYHINADSWDSLHTTIDSGYAQTFGAYDRKLGRAIIQQGPNWFEMTIGTPDLNNGSSWGVFGNNDIFLLKFGL